MGYINKTYLKTQFDNFASRISDVFARKTESGYSLNMTDDGQLQLLNKNGTVLSTVDILEWK